MPLILVVVLCGCGQRSAAEKTTVTITDQIGRTVEIPRHPSRISALHHFGGQIVYALKQQDKLVEQSLYGMEAAALAKVDAHFASMPNSLDGHTFNAEYLVSLRPQVVFVYASFDKSDMVQLENAGVKVIAVRGETIEESFKAVELMAKVLNCPDKGQAYLDDCRRLISLVQDRLKDVPPDRRPRVMFTGPKSIYTVATGEMLQSQVLALAGGANVATGLKGFWADISPEQVATWNPDVIFIGSSLATYGVAEVLANPQFKTVKAVRARKVYVFPSNIGWWDYPAPHCVLGVVWTAKTLYPERFRDIDMRAVADDFYQKHLGHTFTAMGGKL